MQLLLLGMLIVLLEAQVHDMHKLINICSSWNVMRILTYMCYKPHACKRFLPLKYASRLHQWPNKEDLHTTPLQEHDVMFYTIGIQHD